MTKPPVEPTSPAVTDRELSLTELVARLLRRPRLVFGLPIGLGLLGLLYFQYFGSYAAQSTFAPDQSLSNISRLTALASQFGVNLPVGASGQGQSVDFYKQLLQSPALLSAVAFQTYRFPGKGATDTITGTLLDLYGVTGETRDERTAGIVKVLQGRISVVAGVRANTVSLSVKAPYPELAKMINRRMLDFLNDFNLRARQTKASTEREFVERRLAQAQLELHAAEDSMQQFLQLNRTYQSSPRLTFEAARLQRRVDLHQQVYVTLAQAYEQARIEEVRNTPVITVINDPELYATRARSPVMMGFLAFIVGLMLASGITLGLDYIAQELNRDSAGYRRLENARRGTLGRLIRGGH
jgi:uncharacterized protein involved in exopolysaccharide biosynthesis